MDVGRMGTYTAMEHGLIFWDGGLDGENIEGHEYN